MFINELSTFLTSAFNGIGADLGSKIQFKFDAETGKNDNAKILQGIIKTESTSQLPVKGVKSVKYKYKVELPIPSSLSNKNVILVNSIVEQFSTQYNGTTLDLTDGKGVMTMTMPSTGSFKTEFGQGNIVPLVFTIDLLFTQGAITSGDKVWLLDDYVIPYTYEGLVVEKAGKTSLINDRKYAQTLSTSQTKYYHFKFAYDSNNELCVQLQKDLLEGDANKVYTLKYYDGKSYTSNAPYQTKVVINRNGDTSSAVPDTAFFDLWFTDADDGNNETKYYLALIDDPFDGTTENERYFNTEAEQQLWYANLISNGANYCEIKAPNLNSLYLTDQIYTNTAVNGGYDVFDLVNKNFAVIKAVRPATADYLIEIRKPSYDDACAMGNVYWRGTIDGQPVYRKVATPSSSGDGISREEYNQTISQVWTNERFFYYRVTDAQIGLNKQMSYNLRLNSFQTYYFLQNGDGTRKLNITGSFIEKAHLDRWLYGYEIVNTTAGTKPTQETAIANGYYGKTPDNTTITSTDTFTKITANNYANFTYLYSPIVTFNGKADSKLFEREDLKDVAKRLVAREKFKIYNPQNNSLVNWINENVICWCYVIIDYKPDTSSYYKLYDALGASTQNKNSFMTAYNGRVDSESNEATYFSSTIGYGLSSFVFPILKSEYKSIYFQKNPNSSATYPSLDGIYGIWNSLALYGFMNENSGVSYVKTIKLSIKPPITYLELIGLNYTISGNSLYIYTHAISDFADGGSAYMNDYYYKRCSGVALSSISGGYVDTNRFIWATTKALSNPTRPQACALAFIKDYSDAIEMVADVTLPTIKFKNSDILPNNNTERDRNKDWNPKLNNEDYKELNLTMAGTSFSYPIQKLNTSNPIFNYTEVITADTTKGILKFKPQENNDIFNNSYNNSFNGFVFTNDFTLPIVNTAFDNYIANNKNAYLSFQNQQINTIRQTLLGGAKNIVESSVKLANPATAVSGAKGLLDSGISLLSSAQSLNYQKQQFDLSIDNMKNAPDSLINANGNAIFANAVADFGIYMELYEAIDNELEMANDNMFRDGYTVNRFGQIRDCDHIRKHFNYVRGLLGVMNGIPMSDNVRADLRDMFAQGIRMWTSDNIEYTKENYEVKLETI